MVTFYCHHYWSFLSTLISLNSRLHYYSAINWNNTQIDLVSFKKKVNFYSMPHQSRMLTYKSPCCRRCCFKFVREFWTRSRIIRWAPPRLLLHSRSSFANLNQCNRVTVYRASCSTPRVRAVCLFNVQKAGRKLKWQWVWTQRNRQSLPELFHTLSTRGRTRLDVFSSVWFIASEHLCVCCWFLAVFTHILQICQSVV